MRELSYRIPVKVPCIGWTGRLNVYQEYYKAETILSGKFHFIPGLKAVETENECPVQRISNEVFETRHPSGDVVRMYRVGPDVFVGVLSER